MKEVKSKVERVGLYVRISEQDKVKLTKAQLSKSIENQIAMLKEECSEKNWLIADIYCDEDISGADKNRPEFNRMIKDCENGKINIVLCKSQDRFARDLEIIEKYVHNKFIEWGIRFVTVVDHADTNNPENKKNRQITGLTNEWYLEDLSNNIKKTFDSKRKRGDFVGSFAPYGYKKQRDLKNVNHLIIDPIASEVIKRIYKDYINGYGLRAIAKMLNDDEILSPSEYKWHNEEYINIPNKKYNESFFRESGEYILRSSYFDEKLEKNNIINQFIKFKFENINLQENTKIELYKTNALNVYYTYNEINESDWIKVNDFIPSDINYIRCEYKIEKKYEELYSTIKLNIEKNTDRSSIILEDFCIINNQKKMCFKNEIRYKSLWTKSTIEKILFNPVYIGTLEQGKTTTVSYKNHTKIDLDKNKWRIVNNAHDPIIDNETWNLVQSRKHKKLRCSQNKVINNFSGILKCDYCGKTFISTKCGRKNSKNQTSYYVCSDRETNFLNCINRYQIRQDELEKITINELNKLIDDLRNETKLKDLYNTFLLNDKNINSKIESLNIEKEGLLKIKSKNDKYIKDLYENKLNGFIDTDEYFNLKAVYKEDNEKIINRISVIDIEIKNIYKNKEKYKNINLIINKYNHINKLNYELVHEFISEIKIGIKENNQRKLKFSWNF